MNTEIQFMQTGGVPLTNDLLDVLQKTYDIYNCIAPLAGNLTIIAGCELSGSYVNPGVVAIDGEVLPFVGGALSSTVYINIESQSETFQDQTDKILIIKKTVQFGSATTSYNWADFVKLETLKEIQLRVNNGVTQQQLNDLIAEVEVLKLKTAPIINDGIVMIWRKPLSEIPAGWKECIDYRGKTIVGRDPNDVDFSNINNTGGSKTKIISQTNLPPISASANIVQPYGNPATGGGFDGGGNLWGNRTVTFSIGGNSTPINVMNPHRIVEFIEPNF